ncbi:MAG: S9 family peptidase [Halieaceae bacterium]
MRIIAVLCLLSSPLSWAELPHFAAEDVFRLNYASDPRVSPNGNFVVYTHNFMDIMEDRRRSNLWRIDISGDNARPLTTGAVNDRGAQISPDSARIAYLSRDDKGSQIFVRWLEGGETLQVTRLAQSPGNLAWSPDGEWLAFTMLVPKKPDTMGKLPAAPKGAEWAKPPTVVTRSRFRFDGAGMLPEGFSHVFVVSASGGAPRQLTSGDFNHGGSIDWAADSKSLFITGNRHENWELDPNNTEIYRVGIEGGHIAAVTDRQGPDNGVTVSSDGKRLAWVGYDDQRLSYQHNHLYVMNIADSEPRQLLPELDQSVQNPQWSSDNRGIYFQFDERGLTRLAYVSLRGKLQEISSELGGLSLSRPYTGAAFSVGGKNTVAATVGSSTSPADIAVGRSRKAPERVTNLNENLLAHRELANVEELWLNSSYDNNDIQAWVAYPPGFDPAKKYPLLLEIHGGPATAYGPHFAAEIQLFAAAGYVVVYANPRGSTSYGAEFAQLIHHNYPSEDYDDLISTVDAVINKGFIDEDQLYVTGGSGGGVLTAWIVGKTDRFRAAVVAKPVINWISFALAADLPALFAQYWFPVMPWEDPMHYWKRSPLSLVGNVTTPTMLLTGEEDWRTPMWESEQFYQALKLRQVDTALVRVPGSSHSIARRPSQLIAKVAAILEWFERHSGKAKDEVENQPETAADALENQPVNTETS